ncbi:hypothetical protein Pcinc_004338 [Petrolisthes cinctipes]|uniref:Ig-like domain-containing protein n=1 Tax=Petrolisthes cinctipes TaxID=88211 RepID=A0AAE1GLM6_PETCI|nr:hypothetical protein Pcinc_004338 [Petrolisthes cinctipes]
MVYTDLGVEAGSIIGPLIAGNTLHLICRATGGSPPPTVTWLDGTSHLDMISEVETQVLVANILVMPSLKRQDLFRSLTCHATNSNLTAPLSTTVTIDINFPPLWVQLRSSREPVSAGRVYVVVCQAAGARPPAIITWHLSHTRINAQSINVSDQGNVTTSELRLMPKVEDLGKTLSCQAQSPGVPSHSLKDEWRLNVYYADKGVNIWNYAFF